MALQLMIFEMGCKNQYHSPCKHTLFSLGVFIQGTNGQLQAASGGHFDNTV